MVLQLSVTQRRVDELEQQMRVLREGKEAADVAYRKLAEEVNAYRRGRDMPTLELPVLLHAGVCPHFAPSGTLLVLFEYRPK